MARKTTKTGPRPPAQGKAARSGAARRRPKPTRRPPTANCRNGQLQKSPKRSAASAAANPAPRGELEHIDPFTLLVAVVLSAQATDAGVNKATPALFKLADTPEKMAASSAKRGCAS